MRRSTLRKNNLIAISVLVLPILLIQGCLCQPQKVPVSSDSGPEDSGSPESTEPTFSVSTHPTSVAALASILEKSSPTVIGFGEFHQQNDTVHVLSALERFSSDLLPLIGATASDLIVETWFSKGNCGESEAQVVKQVDKVSERPAETENETIRLLKKAKSLGIQPHILEIECTDYDAVRDSDGGVDYLELLELVGSRLGSKADEILTRRISSAQEKGIAKIPERRIVAVYGGAIHNDITPQEGFEGVSFAETLKKKAKGKYIEIDLLVPEFVETSKILNVEPWYPSIREKASPNAALLIEIAPHSYAIVFKRQVSNTEIKQE